MLTIKTKITYVEGGTNDLDEQNIYNERFNVESVACSSKTI